MKTATVAVLAILAWAIPTRAHAQRAPLVIAWQAPVGPSGPNYNMTKCDPVVLQNCFNCPHNSTTGSTEFVCFLNNVLPNISGIGFTVPWGEIDNCGSQPQSTPCVADDTCGTSGNCYKWSWLDNALTDFTNSLVIGGTNTWYNGCAGGRPCKIVLIVTLTSDSGNANLYNNTIPNTPAYVFTQTYANQAGLCPPYGTNTSCPPQDVVICQQRQGTNTGSSGGWPVAAPLTDACWNSGGISNDFGLWNEGERQILKTVSGCMQNNTSVTTPYRNHSGYPVMYEKPILTAAENFLSALALHYSPACTYSSCGSGPTIATSIAYMRIGPSSGGENFPYCACQSSTGATRCDPPSVNFTYWPGPQGYDLEPHAFTDQGYLTAWGGSDGMGYVASLYSFIHSLNWYFPISTPTEHGPPANLNYTYPDIEAMLANQYGLGMGMQAASVGDLVTAAAQSFPPTLENWAAHFREFPNVPVHHLQTMIPGNSTSGTPLHAAQFSIVNIGVSSPGQLNCNAGATNDCSIFCNSPWVFISGTSNSVFNGIWETQPGTNPPNSSGCTANSIQLLAPYPSGTSSGGFVYSPAHLPVLLPFEMQQCQGSFQTICAAEIWEETLDWTYGTNTNSFSIGNTGLGDSTYQVAIQNFLAGLPSATSTHSHMSTNANHY